MGDVNEDNGESFRNDIFKVNSFQFQDKTRMICMQSQNGPCPIIAILNCLLLEGKIVLDSNTEYLTGENMISRLIEYIIETENSNDLDIIINHLKELQTGLMVNVRFSNVLDFEDCNSLCIFKSLGIRLFHGWVMDSQDTPDYEHLKNYTYEQAAIDVLRDDVLAPETKIYLDEFIKSTQLTYPGLIQLNECMREKELAILFHNNHFSVIHKQNNVYILSTDVCFGDKAPWLLLNSINGDIELVNDRFEPVSPNSYNDTITQDSDLELAKKLLIDDDYEYARELQEKENEDLEPSLQMPQQQNNALNNNPANNQENTNVTSNETLPSHERSKEWSCILL